MRLFSCQHCGQVLYFENTRCEKCAHRLGYLAQEDVLSAVEEAGDARWTALAAPDRRFRFCANAAFDTCNWLIADDATDEYCLACRHNRTVPNLDVAENRTAWRNLELAKHRLFYTLLRLKVPLENRADQPSYGLVFDFLADSDEAGVPKVLTGHDDGVITVSLAEADDAERERRRVAMGEPYRTLLGHFRHEVGHYYWDRLVRDAGKLEQCRAMFGDDTADYMQALKTHYEQGAPADWQQNHVSSYATSHAWEDFAETWAHYLHIVDTLEMADAFGMRVQPKVEPSAELSADINFDPYTVERVESLVEAWLPLTFAFNSINRCMGEPDLYPFILSPPAIAKLGFIHDLVLGRI